MKAFLVRIGVDQAYGGWNAPVDPATGEFVYVPIPESATEFHPNCERKFEEMMPSLSQFYDSRQLTHPEIRFNSDLLKSAMHLDPDFECLTYGDDGSRRGAGIAALDDGDLLAFYGGFRPVSECGHKLLYALVGLCVVEEVVKVTDIQPDRWHQNAHTRKMKHWPHDIVVRAKRGISGRLERCLPIGEWRDGAYRVRNDLLEAWGGLSVRNGFIQRSAVPPSFLKPDLFYEWFKKQQVILRQANN